MTIIISDPGKLERTKASIALAGDKSIHVLADFDRTLTTAFVDGKSVPSLISVLRDGNYLAPGYAEKAHALVEKYHPIEMDPLVPFKEKWVAMDEWWRAHSKLLIESGLEKSDLEKVAAAGKVKLRDGFVEFAKILYAHKIPLVIMSASGIGAEGIPLYLEHEGVLSENIHVISNEYEWDENGKAIAIREPIIHALSKYETAIQEYPIFETIRERKNVILLGDSMDDVGMVHGFDYDNLITIGFLNSNIEANQEYYAKVFDVVLTGDTDMKYVNELLFEIVQ